MLLNKHQRRQKTALIHSRELMRLSRQRWGDAMWQPCEPFQHGWIRDYILRDDATRRPDAKDLVLILSSIGGKQWCKEREFLTKEYNGKSRCGNVVPMSPPPISAINVGYDAWTRQETGWKLPEGFKKKYFHYHGVNAPWCDCSRPGQYYRPAHYYFRFPWLFEMRVRPAIITKLPVVDGDLESRIAWLENHMQYYDEWNIVRHMTGHGAYHRDSVKSRLLDQAACKDLQQEDYATESNPHP